MKIRNHSKALFTFLASILGVATTHASINLSGVAIENPRDSSGTRIAAGNLVLVLIDTANDGFAASTSGSLALGDDISTSLGASDDIIVGRNTSEALVPGLIHTAPGTANFELGNGIDVGDSFAIVFFDDLPSNSLNISNSTNWSFSTDASWLVPNDGSYNFNATPNASEFQQLEDLQATLELAAVPEPSHWALACSSFVLIYILRKKQLKSPSKTV